MRTLKFTSALIIVFLFAVMHANAQLNKINRAFAVTGETPGNVNWSIFREIDLSTGAEVRTLYAPVASQLQSADLSSTLPYINENMVAAISYDGTNKRLYYTTMKGNDLRYLDLTTATAKLVSIPLQSMKTFVAQPGEASVITRMAFSANGFGYALTNDGEHLIRFTTGEKVTIADMGAIKDGAKNNEHSVHASCQSWGGDMIGDASGSLYLFTMRGNVYKINPSTKVADFIGAIKNLPADYSVNAATVDAYNNIIIGSAVNTSGYYKVNINTLDAIKVMEGTTTSYNVSDFATANILNAKNSSSVSVKAKEVKGNNLVSIYPNPITDRNFTIQFTNYVNDNYSIQVRDMTGKAIMQKAVSIAYDQSENMTLPATITNGVYNLIITNSNGVNVYTGKIIVD